MSPATHVVGPPRLDPFALHGMAGIHASFNPWTVLDSNDPGDVVIGKTKTKEDAAAGKKPAAAAGAWAPSSKAMEASTPATKKQYKKKLPAAAARDQANKKGPGGAAKPNGAGKGTNKNGAK